MENLTKSVKEIKELPVFFIVGSPRSGTTLLRTIFDAHPHIAIPLENPFVLSYYKMYHRKTMWDKETLARLSHEIIHEKHKEFWSIKKWKVTEEDLFQSLIRMEGNSTYSDILKAIYLAFRSIFPKKEIQIIGDKVPVYSYFISRLLKIFPDAKFIHITRDYRDQALSLRKVDFGSHLTPIAAIRWKKCQQIIEMHKKQMPDNFYFLRYEDLVNDPEGHVKKICDFLKIGFLPEMIHFADFREKAIQTYREDGIERYHGSLLEPINTLKIGKWKNDMPEKEIKIADMLAGKWAEKYGYERKYKGFYPFQYFYVLPVYAHLALQWFLGLFIRLLSRKAKNKIIYRRSLFEKYYEIIYMKLRGLEEQKVKSKK